MAIGTFRVENWLLEAEIIEGLADHVIAELEQVQLTDVVLSRKNLIQFTFTGNIRDLLQLHTVNALYYVLSFDIPRPKALLGHQHFHGLTDAIGEVQAFNDPFQSLYIDAAGSDSSVMIRLKNELASQLGIEPDNEKGDLLLRMRRSLDKKGWDVLIRLTERPLATRDWRVCNYEGALNATVAASMAQWIGYQPNDRVLNLMSGSGSILIEFLRQYPDANVIGIDNQQSVMECATSNIAAAKFKCNPVLIMADAENIPLQDNSFDTILADLPFGQLVGSHEQNRLLYPAIFQETARITKKNGKFLLLTHEIKLLGQLLDEYAMLWRKLDELRINLNGLHPRLYLLEKQ